MSIEHSFKIGGTLEISDLSYVKRQADYDLYRALKKGEYCSLFNSRQVGKSSLETRVRNQLELEGFASCYIDVQAIESTITQEKFYNWIVDEISSELLKDFDIDLWIEGNNKLSCSRRLLHFLENILLSKIEKDIVIFIDEIDNIFSFNFSLDDFFKLIRSCYNKRSKNIKYKRLTFCLIGVAVPSDLIKNRSVTPYNIGTEIELTGFTFEEAKTGLLLGLSSHLDDPERVLKDILYWTGGQPFLTQKICRLVVEQENRNPDIDKLVQTRIIENWEAGDRPQHLTYIQNRISSNHRLMQKILAIYQSILQGDDVKVDNSYEQRQLLLSGLVVKDRNKLKVYNPIYKEVFNENWVENQLATVLDVDRLRRELSELGIKLRDRGQTFQGNEVLRIASLAIEFQDLQVETVMLLSQISFAYLELQEFQKAEDEIQLALEYLGDWEEFQNLQKQIALNYADNQTTINSVSQKLQTLIHVYYTKGILSKKQGDLEEALQAYTKAFTIFRYILKTKIDILSKEIIFLDIVEAIHKNLIELINHSKDIDFTANDVTSSLIQYLYLHYAPITKLLDAKEWKKADEETYRIMTQKVGKEGIQMLVKSDFDDFSIEDLYVINALWEKSSHGKFGFRRQTEIWLKSGGKIGQTKLAPLIEFWQAVGWVTEGELSEIELKEIKYQADTPDGHLPTTGLRFQEVSLFSRFVTCDRVFFDSLMSNYPGS